MRLLNLTAAFAESTLTKHMRMSEERLLSVKHLYSIFVNYIALGFPWSYLAIGLPENNIHTSLKSQIQYWGNLDMPLFNGNYINLFSMSFQSI